MSAPTRILRSPQLAPAGGIAARQPAWLPRPPCPEPTRAPPSSPSSPSSPRTPELSILLQRHGGAHRSSNLSAVWFSANFPRQSRDPPPRSLGSDPDKPPDDRKVKLGKTLRILQDRLPTLLQTPLPQEVLSPHITLHLFPSTHPHLPAVTGRVAYVAALWSSPIAWNRVPIVGNVRLEILSERMVAAEAVLRGRQRPAGAVGEQLIVRWRTASGGSRGLLSTFINGSGGGDTGGKSGSARGGSRSGSESESGDRGTEYRAPVGTAQPAGDSSKEFTGLFIFDFDGEGRVLSHTIEHVQEGGQWERGVGAKVVGLTDWLLGGMKGSDESPCPAFTRKGR